MPQTKEEYNEYMRNYWKTHPEKYRTQLGRMLDSQIKQQKFLKEQIFTLLGGKCANPYNLLHPDWCNDYRCLQIDHINGGGNKERKRHNYLCFYRYILKQIKSGSKDYQLLCANCNWIKRHTNQEGPHRKT